MDGELPLVPLGVSIAGDIEFRGKAGMYRARVRWRDPETKSRASKSESFATREEAEGWIEQVERAATHGVDPKTARATLAEYGNTHWDTAMRGVEPKALALPDWATLQQLSNALVQASSDQYQGRGDTAVFAACTATRIGEVSGCRIGDIDTDTWVWMLRRQTTPRPGWHEGQGH